MKYHLALLFGGVLCLGTLIPSTAEAKPHGKKYKHKQQSVVVINIGPAPYHHYGRPYRHRKWVPGHFVWHRDHRDWVPGRYVYW